MRNLALLTGSALALSFAFASAAEDKTANPPAAAPPASAEASAGQGAPATPASTPAPTVTSSAPIDLSTPEPAAAPAASAQASAGSPAAPSSSIDDLEKQLSDNQEKLTTSLHSYELLNEENQRLKSDSEKLAADKASLEAEVEELKKSVTFYQAQGAIAGQVDSLRTQLRQTQNEVAALASENAEFRTRIALEGPMPASTMSAPTRPAAAASAKATAALAPVPVEMAPLAAPAPAAPAAPEKPAAPRFHVVVAGDSLTKLSKQYYGTANRYGEILGANRKLIRNEDILPLGAKLVIP